MIKVNGIMKRDLPLPPFTFPSPPFQPSELLYPISHTITRCTVGDETSPPGYTGEEVHPRGLLSPSQMEL